MEYNNSFTHDLKLGNIGEKTLANILSSKKVEVKTDFMSHKTGNVFIEYESRNKPSGISTSEAEFWSFVLVKLCIVIVDKNRLKNICRRYIGTDKDKVGGDNNTSKGILLPVSELIKL